MIGGVVEVSDVKNFPNDEKESALVEFMGIYGYLSEKDTKYFFKSKEYYKRRVSSLVEKGYLRKIKTYYTLNQMGKEYLSILNLKYYQKNRNKKYLPRLLYISHLAAKFFYCDNVKFIPAFLLKDKAKFTTTSRKYVGVLNIEGVSYLTYHITSKSDKKYVLSVIYDIQKEKEYEYFIIFVEDVGKIDVNNFVFGKKQVLIIEDTEINEDKIKYISKINWYRVIEDYYNNNIYLSEYSFCDYTDYKNKYVSMFYLLDSEKINKIKYFLKENQNRSAEIVCSKEVEPILRKEVPDANYVVIDIEKYIEKEKRYYD